MCTFYFYNKNHLSTIHFSKLSARVHSQQAHVEMVFIKTNKGSSKAGSTVIVSLSLHLHPSQYLVLRWEARGPFCLNTLLFLDISTDKAWVWLPHLCLAIVVLGTRSLSLALMVAGVQEQEASY